MAVGSALAEDTGLTSPPAMPLRDPRPWASVLVALLAVAVLAQGVRVVLRVLAFREALVTYDFLTRSGLQPGASLDFGNASLVRGLIEALVVLVLLMPLQATVLVL